MSLLLISICNVLSKKEKIYPSAMQCSTVASSKINKKNAAPSPIRHHENYCCGCRARGFLEAWNRASAAKAAPFGTSVSMELKQVPGAKLGLSRAISGSVLY